MSGQPKNQERGVQGGQVILDVKFRAYQGGPLVDDDRFATLGTLPIVQIYDPSNNLVADSSMIGQPGPIRLGLGEYEYTRAIGASDVVSDKWRIVWSLQINGAIVPFEEYFQVKEIGDAEFEDEQEFRVGFAFNNPDLTSQYHAAVNFSEVAGTPDIKGWGYLVHPDELRYLVGFGNKLVSPDANQTYDDNMLQWYIDVSIAQIERYIEYDILPRTIRHNDPVNKSDGAAILTGGTVSGDGNSIVMSEKLNLIPRADIPPEDEEPDRIREEPYPYRKNNAAHYLYVRLRRRPVREMMKAIMADPIQSTIIDLYPWRQVRKEDGSVQFAPDLASIGNFPYMPSRLTQSRYPFHDFPGALWFDYKTGFANAADVPKDIRAAVLWYAGILLMEDFSDGKAPGIASASVNLNSVSESYSTTQSATNSLLGARIAYYKEHLKQWLETNKYKYQRTLLGHL